MNAFECVRRVYHMDGLRGFYRGMSASYAGISETVIHFVIYESIKRKLSELKANSSMDEDEESVKNASDFVGMMLAAATSKTCATSIAYPHGNHPPLHVVLFWATAMKMNGRWQIMDAHINLLIAVFFLLQRWSAHGFGKKAAGIALFSKLCWRCPERRATELCTAVSPPT